MKEYKIPEIEITKFSGEDIVRTSDVPVNSVYSGPQANINYSTVQSALDL